MRKHPHEADRLESLRSYAILDTPPEPSFDALTRLASLTCRAPVALISLVGEDQQWVKSAHGVAAGAIRREASACNDIVAGGVPIVVPDLRTHPRYGPPHWDTRLRGYAGVPLVGRDALPLGALCVADVRPRRFGPDQLQALTLLAEQVVARLELHRIDRAAGRRRDELLAEITDPLRLRRALDDGELQPHFQPIVDLATGRTIGFEALLRWRHPHFGLLPPSAFLPTIESSGLIMPVGRHVLDRSLGALADLRRTAPGARNLTVAVNVSGAQLDQPGLARSVADALDRYDVRGPQLTVEITETAPFHDAGSAGRELADLSRAGVQLALDDYGVGFSGLGRLLDLPLTALKLDRSLVTGLPHHARSRAIARSTCVLAADMGMVLICEGIETTAQRDVLLDFGAPQGQGWLYGRPVPPEDLAAYVAAPLHPTVEAARETGVPVGVS